MVPKVSVIIPVYNTALFLRRCLDSVCSQALRDIEILCVNDASPDNAHDILCEYARQDARIMIIDFSQNRGVSAARNAAIAIARGEFLGFVDSDDAVGGDFYALLYAKASATGAVIAKAVRRRISEDGTVKIENINERVRRNRLHFNVQWTTAIYKTDFIRTNGIDCPLGVVNAEDGSFLLKAAYLAPSIETIDDTYYQYHRRQGSAAAEKLPHHRILSVLDAYTDVAEFAIRHNNDPASYVFLFFTCVSACCSLAAGKSYIDDADSPMACAKVAIRLYSLCHHRAALDALLAAELPVWQAFIAAGDAVGLAKILARHRISGRLLADSLRMRLQKTDLCAPTNH